MTGVLQAPGINNSKQSNMSNKVGKILAVDDNEDILFALKLLLKQHVELISTVSNPEQIPREAGASTCHGHQRD